MGLLAHSSDARKIRRAYPAFFSTFSSPRSPLRLSISLSFLLILHLRVEEEGGEEEAAVLLLLVPVGQGAHQSLAGETFWRVL